MIGFSVNGKRVDLDVDPSTPLLWVIREQLSLTGTKYGCGMAQCGACTVHINGEAVRSCVAPVSRAEGKHVTVLESWARWAHRARVEPAGGPRSAALAELERACAVECLSSGTRRRRADAWRRGGC